MNESKKERLSFREAMAYTRRAFAIWWRAEPKLFIAAAVNKTVSALTPYVPL